MANVLHIERTLERTLSDGMKWEVWRTADGRLGDHLVGFEKVLVSSRDRAALLEDLGAVDKEAHEQRVTELEALLKEIGRANHNFAENARIQTIQIAELEAEVAGLEACVSESKAWKGEAERQSERVAELKAQVAAHEQDTRSEREERLGQPSRDLEGALTARYLAIALDQANAEVRRLRNWAEKAEARVAELEACVSESQAWKAEAERLAERLMELEWSAPRILSSGMGPADVLRATVIEHKQRVTELEALLNEFGRANHNFAENARIQTIQIAELKAKLSGARSQEKGMPPHPHAGPDYDGCGEHVDSPRRPRPCQPEACGVTVSVDAPEEDAAEPPAPVTCRCGRLSLSHSLEGGTITAGCDECGEIVCSDGSRPLTPLPAEQRVAELEARVAELEACASDSKLWEGAADVLRATVIEHKQRVAELEAEVAGLEACVSESKAWKAEAERQSERVAELKAEAESAGVGRVQRMNRELAERVTELEAEVSNRPPEPERRFETRTIKCHCGRTHHITLDYHGAAAPAPECNCGRCQGWQRGEVCDPPPPADSTVMSDPYNPSPCPNCGGIQIGWDGPLCTPRCICAWCHKERTDIKVAEHPETAEAPAPVTCPCGYLTLSENGVWCAPLHVSKYLPTKGPATCPECHAVCDADGSVTPAPLPAQPLADGLTLEGAIRRARELNLPGRPVFKRGFTEADAVTLDNAGFFRWVQGDSLFPCFTSADLTADDWQLWQDREAWARRQQEVAP